MRNSQSENDSNLMKKPLSSPAIGEMQVKTGLCFESYNW